MHNVVIGANELNYHYLNANYGRDFAGKVCDIINAREGDLCPCCGKPMGQNRGIEVGQIFKLQTKYSEPMKCTYVNEKGENVPMRMGCYGIGVTRTLQSIVDQYHDEHGIKWPLNVAPYHAVIVPITIKDETQYNLANQIYEELKKEHIEVIFDDRDAKPGFKFKDWELIGIPYMVICGKKSNEGIVEFKNRQTLDKEEISYTEAIERIVSTVKSL